MSESNSQSFNPKSDIRNNDEGNSNMTAQPPSPEDKKSDHLNIRVSGHGQSEIFFKIKKTTQLKKLMEAYCERLGKQPGSLRFLFDGQRISPNDTPQQLGLQNEDCIEVMVEQFGGNGKY